MKYIFHELGEQQFEKLVVMICKEILGIGTHGFAPGTDGGRDAKFVGKANLFPSTSKPWDGTTIIQAKHTNGPYETFSDPSFFKEDRADSVIVVEAKRIKKLIENNDLDHYLLFSNRRLTGNTDKKIKDYLCSECSIKEGSIYLQDINTIEEYLKQFPDIPEKAELNPFDAPLNFSPDELAEVIEKLAEDINDLSSKSIPTDRFPYEKKNELNSFSKEVAKGWRKNYLKETSKIKDFLEDPLNEELKEKYECVAEEFNLKILSKRSNYNNFEEVLEYLVDQLYKKDVVLRKNRRLTRTIIFYMYWNCDIGNEE